MTLTSPNGAQVRFTTFQERWSDPALKKILSYFPEPVRTRISRQKRPIRRQVSLLGKLLLLECLDQKGRLDVLEKMAWSEHGKPLLKDHGNFSITHAGNNVACAWSPNGRIGIDVEPARELPLDAVSRFASPGERELLLGNQSDSLLAIRLWTRKEALLKADGRGFRLSAPAVDVISDEVVLDEGVFKLMELDLGPGMVACLAAEGVDPALIDVREIEVGELLSCLGLAGDASVRYPFSR